MDTLQDQDDKNARLQTELELLESMYPSTIQYRPQTREVQYSPDNSSSTTSQKPVTTNTKLRLVLPTSYPSSSLPSIISATNYKGKRVDEQLEALLSSLEVGEEALDVFIDAFNTILEAEISNDKDASNNANASKSSQENSNNPSYKTVIIWLHHLLNTNKRKQVLSPPQQTVSGISKPGYPGVLVFSGTKDAVDEHVYDLKALNWQAFQVRYEEDARWMFEHEKDGHAVVEVETISEVIKKIGDDVKKREIFMEAMRMK